MASSFLRFAFLGEIETPPEVSRKVMQLDSAQALVDKLTQENGALRQQYREADRERMEAIHALALMKATPTPPVVTMDDSALDVAQDEDWDDEAVAREPPPFDASLRSLPEPEPEPLRPTVPAPPSLKDKTQSKVVMLITGLMCVVLILSLGGVITLSILERPVPDILPMCITSPLGYFGGLLSAYFGIQQAQKPA